MIWLLPEEKMEQNKRWKSPLNLAVAITENNTSTGSFFMPPAIRKKDI